MTIPLTLRQQKGSPLEWSEVDGNFTALRTGIESVRNAVLGHVTGDAPMFACRAWVNFNGTGTPAIRASGNVSSVTRNGTGDYTVNFVTAMPDANYAATVTSSSESGVGGIPTHHQDGILSNNAWSYRFRLSDANLYAAQRDSANCYVAIFR